MIHFVTACNGRYFERMRPYLDSIQHLSRIPVTLICVGFRPPLGSWIEGLDKVKFITMPHNLNEGSPSESESPQHGSYLKLIPGNADDVYLFTDGDITLQRDFADAEIAMLENLPKDQLIAGYNSGPSETLAVEGERLFPKIPQTDWNTNWPLIGAPCYNIGVIAGRRDTLWDIYSAYMHDWGKVGQLFGHGARQQWLVCYEAARLGIKVNVAGYAFHANGHYGTPPGVLYENGQITYQGQTVLFRHRL